MTDDLAARIRDRALAGGFDAVGFAPATGAPETAENLRTFLEAGHHGDMGWMARDPEKRARPNALWPEAKSVVVLGKSYAPEADPMARHGIGDEGAISVYAQGRDYHKVMRRDLRALAAWIHTEADCDVKFFVDTAPVMEKPLAQQAGIGWQGKHSNLVSRDHGSWLFLGEIYMARELVADPPETDHCGSCHRCLDVCPTDAFPAPYRLDATRCISYLTIEHKGPIPRDLRPGMGNRIYGCDDCLAVCPWNKFATTAAEPDFLPRAELTAPRLADLSRLTDETYRALFQASPIKRTGRDRFVRNVLIAVGNSGDPALIPDARARLDDASPLVRGAAVWALSRLMPAGDFYALKAARAGTETDPDVQSEWVSL